MLRADGTWGAARPPRPPLIRTMERNDTPSSQVIPTEPAAANSAAGSCEPGSEKKRPPSIHRPTKGPGLALKSAARHRPREPLFQRRIGGRSDPPSSVGKPACSSSLPLFVGPRPSAPSSGFILGLRPNQEIHAGTKAWNFAQGRLHVDLGPARCGRSDGRFVGRPPRQLRRQLLECAKDHFRPRINCGDVTTWAAGGRRKKECQGRAGPPESCKAPQLEGRGRRCGLTGLDTRFGGCSVSTDQQRPSCTFKQTQPAGRRTPGGRAVPPNPPTGTASSGGQGRRTERGDAESTKIEVVHRAFFCTLSIESTPQEVGSRCHGRLESNACRSRSNARGSGRRRCPPH